MTARLLIVEDEPAIRELLRVNLAHAGYGTESASNVAEARELLRRGQIDLIVLDWMLPDESGIDLAKQVRRGRDTGNIPILLLTARSQEGDKLSGFEAGVDDYLTKPFSPRELLARIQALLRRSTPSVRVPFHEFDGLRHDPVAHRVTANGETVNLSPTEMQLLSFLMSNADRVLTRTAILDNVWGNAVSIEERTVDVHMRRLRIALQDTGHDRLIETVRGVGYRFRPSMPK